MPRTFFIVGGICSLGCHTLCSHAHFLIKHICTLTVFSCTRRFLCVITCMPPILLCTKHCPTRECVYVVCVCVCVCVCQSYSLHVCTHQHTDSTIAHTSSNCWFVLHHFGCGGSACDAGKSCECTDVPWVVQSMDNFVFVDCTLLF